MDYEEWVQTSKAYDKEMHEAQDHLDRIKKKKADLAICLKQEGFETGDEEVLASDEKLSNLYGEGFVMIMMGTTLSLASLALMGLFIAHHQYAEALSPAPILIGFFIMAMVGRKKRLRALKIQSFINKQSQHNKWKNLLKETLTPAPLKRKISGSDKVTVTINQNQ